MKGLAVILTLLLVCGGIFAVDRWVIPRISIHFSKGGFVKTFAQTLEAGDADKIMSCYSDEAETTIFLLADNPFVDKWSGGDTYLTEERYTLTREGIEDFYQSLGKRYAGKFVDYGHNSQGDEPTIWFFHKGAKGRRVLLQIDLKLIRTKEGDWKITHSSIAERAAYLYTPSAT